MLSCLQLKNIDPCKIVFLLGRPLLSTQRKLTAEGIDLVDELRANCLNFILLEPDLNQEVPVFCLTSRQLFLVQVDHDSEPINFSLKTVFGLLDTVISLDAFLLDRGCLSCFMPRNLVQVSLLDPHELSLVSVLGLLNLS